MKGPRTRGLALGLTVIVATFALAACGSSSKKSSSSSSTSGGAAPASTSTSPSSTATGTPFKIGFICSCSGAAAAQLAKEGDVIKAWASDANAKGGINGHPVTVTVLDDANSPPQAALAAKKLVSQHVMAILDGSLQDAAFEKTVAAAGVPVLGALTVQSVYFTNPDFFPSGAVLPAVILGQVIEANKASLKHMGVTYCSEVPVCAQLVGLVQGSVAAVGGGLQVSGQAVSMTAPSYTAPCLALKTGGADNMFAAVTAPVVVRIVDACAQQGYKPVQVNQTTTALRNWLKDPNLQGPILLASQAPWIATSIPAIKEYTDAMDKYVPGLTSAEDFGADLLSPWIAGKLFEAAAKAGNLTPSSTSADVKKGLYALKNETLGGLTGPLNYTPGKPSFPSCYWVVSIKDGQFTTPQGTNFICPPTAAVTKLQQLLAKAA
jgi:branched-chain amino acid transport system substrate-binding protein